MDEKNITRDLSELLSIPKTSSTFPGAHDVNSIVLRTNDATRSDGSDSTRWAEVISSEPRAIIYHNFLSEEECEHLISLAKPHMARSQVVNRVTGKGIDSSARTSTGRFLNRGQDKTVQSIEKRIAEFTDMPVEHGEGLQVIHYEVGQKFVPHYDSSLVIQRMVTVLMYLSDVEEGGETVFPKAKRNISAVSGLNELSESTKNGLSVKPKMGDALIFWSMTPDATLDPLSLHGGSPVIKGNKWACTKWIWVKPYNV